MVRQAPLVAEQTICFVSWSHRYIIYPRRRLWWTSPGRALLSTTTTTKVAFDRMPRSSSCFGQWTTATTTTAAGLCVIWMLLMVRCFALVYSVASFPISSSGHVAHAQLPIGRRWKSCSRSSCTVERWWNWCLSIRGIKSRTTGKQVTMTITKVSVRASWCGPFVPPVSAGWLTHLITLQSTPEKQSKQPQEVVPTTLYHTVHIFTDPLGNELSMKCQL